MEEKFNLCKSMRKEKELAKKYYKMKNLADEALRIVRFCDEIELEDIKKSYIEGAWNELKIWDAESQEYLRNKRKLCKSATQEEAEDEILFIFSDLEALDENFKELFDAKIDRKVFKENLNEAVEDIYKYVKDLANFLNQLENEIKNEYSKQYDEYVNNKVIPILRFLFREEEIKNTIFYFFETII